jgi:hypothetical protein
MGTLTSWNPLGLSRPVTGLLYLFTIKIIKYLKKKSRFYHANFFLAGKDSRGDHGPGS